MGSTPRISKLGAEILDLGCFAGGLAAKLATDFPDATVRGVDRLPKLLRACNEHYGLPNLSFLTWDYQRKKVPSLQPADLLLCVLGTDGLAAPARSPKL